MVSMTLLDRNSAGSLTPLNNIHKMVNFSANYFDEKTTLECETLGQGRCLMKEAQVRNFVRLSL